MGEKDLVIMSADEFAKSGIALKHPIEIGIIVEDNGELRIVGDIAIEAKDLLKENDEKKLKARMILSAAHQK